MKAGSGKHGESLSRHGREHGGLLVKHEERALRAPAASITADSMRREVSVNSRSAVSSGPSSERASTVRNSLRKLFVSTAKILFVCVGR